VGALGQTANGMFRTKRPVFGGGRILSWRGTDTELCTMESVERNLFSKGTEKSREWWRPGKNPWGKIRQFWGMQV